jgi:hypothetical protein
VEGLRERWPHPVAARERQSGEDYCVGGALCQEVLDREAPHMEPVLYWEEPFTLNENFRVAYSGDRMHFPNQFALAAALQRANPNIDHHLASECATRIIEANDQDEFNEAWLWLDKALSA